MIMFLVTAGGVRGVTATMIAALVIAALWIRSIPLEPVRATPAAVLPALAKVAVPLATDDPESDDADLRPLLPLLAHRRVVGLGEVTHGSREFFRLKDRLLRFLVERAGFTTFALEISPASGALMNNYVKRGEGDPREILRRFEFWTWQTEEVLALAQWMRAWNQSQPDTRPLAFVGINAAGEERDRLMADHVLEALESAGPDGRIVVWAHNSHVSTHPEWMGSYIRRQLGEAYYVVGFELFEGDFRSRNLAGLRTHSVSAAEPGYYAFTLAQLRPSIVFLDFATAGRDPVLSEWLNTPRRSRDIDELFYLTQLTERWYSRLDPWPMLYDAIIFVRAGTAAHGLRAGEF